MRCATPSATRLFFSILRHWAQDNRFEAPHVVPDFIRLASKLSGKDLTQFLRRLALRQQPAGLVPER